LANDGTVNLGCPDPSESNDSFSFEDVSDPTRRLRVQTRISEDALADPFEALYDATVLVKLGAARTQAMLIVRGLDEANGIVDSLASYVCFFDEIMRDPDTRWRLRTRLIEDSLAHPSEAMNQAGVLVNLALKRVMPMVDAGHVVPMELDFARLNKWR
jgi:hypothetical protein